MRTINLTTKISIYKIEECNNPEKLLMNAARSATQKAYAPYSNYRVGVALLLETGIIIEGSNQENACYPAGICAERTALFYANSEHNGVPIIAIAITAYVSLDFTSDICSPCGICRQALLEVEERQGAPIRILMGSKELVYAVASVKELLPLSFGKDSLMAIE